MQTTAGALSVTSRRREWRSFAELVGATSLVVAQPMFDRLSHNLILFVHWSITPEGLAALVLTLVLVPALLLWAVERLVAFAGERARTVTHAALVAATFSVLAIEVGKAATSLGPNLLRSAAIVVGLIVFGLVSRFVLVRSFLQMLSVAPVLFVVVALLSTPLVSMAFGRSPELYRGAIATPSRIAMLVMDELPLTSLLDGAGRIDAQLFPNFAALAADSTWYRNETTVSPFTETAVPAILSGQLPPTEHTPPFVSEYPTNLFTLLGAKYRMHVSESVTQLCPPTRCARSVVANGARSGTTGMLHDVFDIWRAYASPEDRLRGLLEKIGVHDGAPVDHALDFIAQMAPSQNRPTLDLLHVLMPHFPWHYVQSLQDSVGLPLHTNGLEGNCCWPTDEIGSLARVRHLAQVQAADTLLGRFVARLRDLGEYDKTLIVVTADHGVAFRSGSPIRGVAKDTWPDIMWTPLLIKSPHQTSGVIDDRRALSVDVLPTVAQIIGLPIPEVVDGRPLQGEARPDGDRPLLTWSSNVIAQRVTNHYLSFDGPSGFRRVIRASAAPPGGDARLRIFRGSNYGSLVGQKLEGFGPGTQPAANATIEALFKNLGVDPSAAKIPWIDVHGWVDLEPGRAIALSMNGTIGAISQTYRAPGSTRVEFWALLPPHLFQPGGNGLALALITGPPSEPRLQTIALAGAK